MNAYESTLPQSDSPANDAWNYTDVVRLTGSDRTSFLHNLCTNDIKRLHPGMYCEAFVTNVQGKTVGHVLVLCLSDSLELITASGEATTLLAHFDRYLITEDVTLANASSEFDVWLLAGPAVDSPEAHADSERIESAGRLPALQHFLEIGWEDSLPGSVAARIINLRATLRNTVDVFLLLCSSAGRAAAESELAGAGLGLPIDWPAERINAGFPLFGVDFGPSNLPQELARDELAISFTKGCYLGQETVARLDALGHVNKQLVGLVGEKTMPEISIGYGGAELTVDERVAGVVSSVAREEDRLIALGMVKRDYLTAGQRLDSALGAFRVRSFSTP